MRNIARTSNYSSGHEGYNDNEEKYKHNTSCRRNNSFFKNHVNKHTAKSKKHFAIKVLGNKVMAKGRTGPDRNCSRFKWKIQTVLSVFIQILETIRQTNIPDTDAKTPKIILAN